MSARPVVPVLVRRYVTLAEAAEYAAVNPRTLRRRIAAGHLTGFRLGPRVVRVDLNELDRVLAGESNA